MTVQAFLWQAGAAAFGVFAYACLTTYIIPELPL